MSRTKVLIVDDSAVVRQVVGALLQASPDIELCGTAGDPLIAMERMKLQWPDVILLDVEMPRMDGITFLKKLMEERPTPVVICSTLTEQGARTTMDALAAGAVAIVTKPKIGLKQFLTESGSDLLSAIRAAAQAKVSRPGAPRKAVASKAAAVKPSANTSARAAEHAGGPVARHPAVDLAGPARAEGHLALRTTERVVALGTSTGGTQALEHVLASLPRVCPGIVVVQHMPEKFTAAFAARLDGLCEIEVKEAETNDRVIQGRALIAPGGRHLVLRRSGAQYFVEVVDGPLFNRHRPSVDVLFRSVARCAGANALGVIMTGMGDDGAAGLLEMRTAGARTLAQDEASCVVYGMPREAVKRGAAEKSVPLDGIGREILAQLQV